MGARTTNSDIGTIWQAPAIAFGFSVLLLLAGCAPPSIRARGTQPMNVNAVNESTPVDVRFYQLNDDGPFSTAPFELLWTDAPKALGGSLVGKPLTRTVFPGPLGDPPATLQLSAFDDGTRFIGALALFRGTDGGARQVVIPASALDDGVLELTGYTVRFSDGSSPPPEAKPAAGQPVETDEQRRQREADERKRYGTPDDR